MICLKSTNTVKTAPLQNCRTVRKHFRSTEISIYLNFDLFCSQYHPNTSWNALDCINFHDFTFLNLHLDMIIPPVWGHTSGQSSSGGRGPSARQAPAYLPQRIQETRLWQGNACQAGPRCGKHAQMWSVLHPGWFGPAGSCSAGLRTETKKLI